MKSLCRIIAEKLYGAVHHHLRCIDILNLQDGGVILLALGVLGRGKSIVPPTVFPIVDVLFEDDNVGGRYRLFTFEPPEEQVRGRTAGAAFGSK
jgi:hypothetical protein